jgi:hypothetical protein
MSSCACTCGSVCNGLFGYVRVHVRACVRAFHILSSLPLNLSSAASTFASSYSMLWRTYQSTSSCRPATLERAACNVEPTQHATMLQCIIQPTACGRNMQQYIVHGRHCVWQEPSQRNVRHATRTQCCHAACNILRVGILHLATVLHREWCMLHVTMMHVASCILLRNEMYAARRHTHTPSLCTSFSSGHNMRLSN